MKTILDYIKKYISNIIEIKHNYLNKLISNKVNNFIFVLIVYIYSITKLCTNT